MGPRMSLSFVTILVLVNLIIVSSAPRTYDTSKDSKAILVLGERDIASEEVKARHFPKTRGIASHSLRVGTHRPQDTVWESRIEIVNKRNENVHFPIEIKLEGSKHTLYLSVLSEPTNLPASIHSPEDSDLSTNEFHADLLPNSTTIMSVLVTGN